MDTKRFWTIVAIPPLATVLGVAAIQLELLGPLGPECTEMCNHWRLKHKNPNAWEVFCHDCCDEIKGGTPCYRKCYHLIDPVKCPKQSVLPPCVDLQ